MVVGRAAHHPDPARQPQRAGHLGEYLSEDGTCGPKRRQLAGRHPGRIHQDSVVLHPLGVPIVGQPRGGHRRRCRRCYAGEAHRQVVHRLEVPTGRRGHSRLIVLEVEHVADGVGAAQRGCTAAAPDPPPQDERRVARHRTSEPPPCLRGAAAVHPQHALAYRPAGVVDRDGARPLAGTRHGDDRAGIEGPRREPTTHRVARDLPPLLGVLHRSASGEQAGGHREVVAPSDGPGERHEADLRAPGPEVDGQDHALAGPERRGAHPAGGTCWKPSIMSAMTERMKASASSVIPPSTPP